MTLPPEAGSVTQSQRTVTARTLDAEQTVAAEGDTVFAVTTT